MNIPTTPTSLAVEAANDINLARQCRAIVDQLAPGRGSVIFTFEHFAEFCAALRAELSRPLEVAAPVGEPFDADAAVQRLWRLFSTRLVMHEWEAIRAELDAASRVPVASVAVGEVCPTCKGQGGGEGWIANENDRSGQSDYRGWVNCEDCNPNTPPTPQDAAPAEPIERAMGLEGDALADLSKLTIRGTE